MDNKNLPAFPPNAGWEHPQAKGLTKREHAFFITLGGCISGQTLDEIENMYPPTIAKIVLKLVDVGFDALENKLPPSMDFLGL
jgi:hypothetical protein